MIDEMKELGPLAKRVKALREKAGMSQQALAVKAGLSVSVVFQIEQGNRRDPQLSTVLALAEAIEVSVDAITVGQLKWERETRESSK